jgi:predicted DNA binding CopG/RHH family protein
MKTTPTMKTTEDAAQPTPALRTLNLKVSEADFRTFKKGAAVQGLKHPDFLSYLLTLIPKSE